MAISKITYKASPSATPETWMDATGATAAASDITAPKTAMLADGVVTVGTGSGNGNANVSQDANGYIIVDDAAPGGGGSPSVPKTVFFYDYDGTLCYSYTAAEFAALSEMPANPDHSEDAIPLTAQGWNWTLANAKAYVLDYGWLNIGQTYKTTDNKTHVLIHLDEGRTSPILGCCPNGTVDVDWGDGTAHDTLTGTSVTEVKWTSAHAYAAPGDYHIILNCTGTMGFYGSNTLDEQSGLLRYTTAYDKRNCVYRDAVRSVYCADTVTSMENSAFNGCGRITYFTIPNSLTSTGDRAFYNCSSLVSIALPNGLSNVGSGMFYYCYSITSINLPGSVTSISASAFAGCQKLPCLTLPDGITAIPDEAFRYCYGLSHLTIPDGITSIGMNAFSNCNCLSDFEIPSELTSIGSYAFYFFSQLREATIPDGVTSIGSNAFAQCTKLVHVDIPDSVTSIGANAFQTCNHLDNIDIPDSVTTIGSNAFQNCYCFTKVIIPAGITQINANVFSNCYGVTAYHILSTTPPPLANVNAFNGISADCVIFVPRGSLAAYQAATNWATYASYMQEEPQ